MSKKKQIRKLTSKKPAKAPAIKKVAKNRKPKFGKIVAVYDDKTSLFFSPNSKTVVFPMHSPNVEFQGQFKIPHGLNNGGNLIQKIQDNISFGGRKAMYFAFDHPFTCGIASTAAIIVLSFSLYVLWDKYS